MREHAIIRRYFGFAGGRDVAIGVGDDAAVLSPPPHQNLAISTDTLTVGVHFFDDVLPAQLARKAAAVSLSDMAAMAATPLWLVVALSAPPRPSDWFAAFAEGLRDSSREFGYAVVGGDLSRAEQLAVTTTVVGACPQRILTRTAAVSGDDIWLSGAVGAAAHAVAVRRREVPAAEDMRAAEQCLHEPQPRLALGAALSGIGNAAMDLSDGLLPAAETLAAESSAALHLCAERIPLASSLSVLSETARWRCALAGGDDYELLFTAPKTQRAAVQALATSAVPLSRIGRVQDGAGVHITLEGAPFSPPARGYEHDFAD